MLAKVSSCAVIGLDATPVQAEVDTEPGLFGLTMVGLPEAAVQESRERVRDAIANLGFFSQTDLPAASIGVSNRQGWNEQ